MKTLKTQERQDESHRVVQGCVGQYGPGDTIPHDVVMQMLAGRPAHMGQGYQLR